MSRELDAVQIGQVPAWNGRTRGWPGTISKPRRQEQHLRAYCAKLARRGYIATGYVVAPRGQQMEAQVRWLKRLPNRGPRIAAAVVLAFGTLTGVGVLLYESRWVIAIGAASFLVLAFGIRLLAGSGGGGCGVVHRPGCGCGA